MAEADFNAKKLGVGKYWIRANIVYIIAVSITNEYR